MASVSFVKRAPLVICRRSLPSVTSVGTSVRRSLPWVLPGYFRSPMIPTPPPLPGSPGEQQAPSSETSRLLLGRGGRAKVVVIKSWPWCVLRVSVVLSSSLSLSPFLFSFVCRHWPPFGRRLAAAAMWVNSWPQLPKRVVCFWAGAVGRRWW